MQQKDRIDAFGATSLVLFSVVLGFNQVVIKVVNGGFQPVFVAGLRSLGALVCLLIWMRLRGHRWDIEPGTARYGLLIGSLFAIEFLLLFLALDLTTVARASVIFYSMPVWLALAAHFLLPGDQLTWRKSFGLAVAVAGVAWAILDREGTGRAQLAGDLLALAAAIFWAGIALTARATPLVRVPPERQLLWQLTVSAMALLLVSPFFGPFLRGVETIHLWGLAYQMVVVAFAAFLFWFWLLKFYPASGVASFSFLSPVFGVIFGWLVLNERLGPAILGALALAVAGLYLINRPSPAAGTTSAQTGR